MEPKKSADLNNQDPSGDPRVQHPGQVRTAWGPTDAPRQSPYQQDQAHHVWYHPGQGHPWGHPQGHPQGHHQGRPIEFQNQHLDFIRPRLNWTQGNSQSVGHNTSLPFRQPTSSQHPVPQSSGAHYSELPYSQMQYHHARSQHTEPQGVQMQHQYSGPTSKSQQIEPQQPIMLSQQGAVKHVQIPFQHGGSQHTVPKPAPKPGHIKVMSPVKVVYASAQVVKDEESGSSGKKYIFQIKSL